MSNPIDDTAGTASNDHGRPVSGTTASVPGFSRAQLGDFTVTAVYDGIVSVDLPANLTGISSDEIDRLLSRAFRANPLPLSINAFVVDTGAHRLIVDTGAGALMGPTSGKLPENLAAAGYAPEDIDAVLLTHLNGDHMGGLVVGGIPFFSREDVRVIVGEADVALWLDASKEDTVAENLRFTFGQAEQMIAPYRDAGRLEPVAPGTQIVPGVHAVASPGHTPGHLGYMIESRGQRMLLWGDIVHVSPVQFAEPDVAIDYDWDSPTAVSTRRSLLADAAAGGYLVAGAHLPFPGIGQIAVNGDGYEYVPIALAPSTGEAVA